MTDDNAKAAQGDVKKLSTEAYKGVRDFYPEDMAVQKQIFSIWQNIAEKYGYQEYSASVLEPAELYRAKSGEEIVNEQTYTFTDRGDREVTLRPEMTPTLARMIAGRKRELVYPLRWYSIPNLFRYEQPQRGRLREHFQLNVDIFGVTSLNAEIEVISMASDIMHSFGLKDNDFEIRINSRKLMNYITREVFALDETKAHAISKLIDRKNKMPADIFSEKIAEILIDKADAKEFETLLNSQNFNEFVACLPETETEHEGIREVREVIAGLEALGIANARFDQSLMRGFDYYTGIVFEVFDKNPINRRSVLGGGRYDELLALFGGEKVPAVGFGAGDVIARDLIEAYGKLQTESATAELAICIISEKTAEKNSATDYTESANEIAQQLRANGLKTLVDYSGKKIADQIKSADRRGIPYIIVIGEDEVSTGSMTLKNLKTGREIKVTVDTVASLIKASHA